MCLLMRLGVKESIELCIYYWVHPLLYTFSGSVAVWMLLSGNLQHLSRQHTHDNKVASLGNKPGFGSRVQSVVLILVRNVCRADARALELLDKLRPAWLSRTESQ